MYVGPYLNLCGCHICAYLLVCFTAPPFSFYYPMATHDDMMEASYVNELPPRLKLNFNECENRAKLTYS